MKCFFVFFILKIVFQFQICLRETFPAQMSKMKQLQKSQFVKLRRKIPKLINFTDTNLKSVACAYLSTSICMPHISDFNLYQTENRISFFFHSSFSVFHFSSPCIGWSPPAGSRLRQSKPPPSSASPASSSAGTDPPAEPGQSSDCK